MKLFEKIKKWHKKNQEIYRLKMENRESVNCPYCGQKYTPKEIHKLEYKTEIKDFSTMKCTNECFCSELFGIKITRHYEPVVSLSRNGIKL